MSRRPSALLLASWLLVPGLSLAEELDPEKVARIRREEKAALAEVDKQHGNKKPSEMSNAERREVIEEQEAAVARVLEKHGVTAKDYLRYTTRMGREDNAAVAEAMERQEAEEKARKEAEARKKAGSGEVVIQQGFNDRNPVVLEGEPEEDSALVEQSLPSEEDVLEPGIEQQEEPTPRPTRSKRGSRRRR